MRFIPNESTEPFSHKKFSNFSDFAMIEGYDLSWMSQDNYTSGSHNVPLLSREERIGRDILEIRGWKWDRMTLSAFKRLYNQKHSVGYSISFISAYYGGHNLISYYERLMDELLKRTMLEDIQCE